MMIQVRTLAFASKRIAGLPEKIAPCTFLMVGGVRGACE